MRYTVTLILLLVLVFKGITQVPQPVSTFGTGGALFFDGVASGIRSQGMASQQELRSLAQQADGKMLAAGASGGVGVIFRYNADGTLDASFGNGGRVPWYFSRIQKMLLQPDGKILLTGYLGSQNVQFLVARLNADGTADASFGTNGIALATMAQSATVYDLALQPDGKIIAVGQAQVYDASLGYSNGDLAVARFNSNGTLDPTFDGDGKKIISVNASGNEQALAVAVAPNGKIVLAGHDFPAGARRPVLVQLLADGTPDVTFDGDGILIETFTSNGYFNDVQILSDNRIVTGGGYYNSSTFAFEAFVMRHTATGSRDAAFDGDGLVQNPGGALGAPVMSLKLLAGDKVLFVVDRIGYSTGPFAVAQLTAAGALDATFDGDGIMTANFATNNFDQTTDVLMDASGKIWVSGLTDNGYSRQYFGLVRINATGGLDATFDGDGQYTYNLASSIDGYKAVGVKTDGKLVAAGTVFSFLPTSTIPTALVITQFTATGQPDATFGTNGSVVKTGSSDAHGVITEADGKVIVLTNPSVSLLRYNADGTPDASFDGDGMATFSSLSGYTLYQPFEVVRNAAGQYLVGCVATYNGSDDIAVLRINANGTLDATFGSGGMARFGTNNQEAAYRMILQSDEKILIAGVMNGQSGVLRFTANGFTDNTFNGSGYTTFSMNFGGATSSPSLLDLTLEAGGKIIFAGSVNNGTGRNVALIGRMNATGGLDASFGTNGTTTTAVSGSEEDVLRFVRIQTDGTILTGGTNKPLPLNNNLLFLRYTANGTIDPTFNNNTGLYSRDIAGNSYDNFVSFAQSGTLVYAAGNILTELQSDFLITATNISASILPVTFQRFTAQKNGDKANLEWMVSAEQNVAYYAVERSTNGNGYTVIGTVNSLGNFSGERTYRFTDANPAKGSNYYRIRSVDRDGKTGLTPIRSLQFNAVATLETYPNPAHSSLIAVLPATGAYPTTLRIVNAKGQVIHRQKVTAAGSVSVPVQGLATGVYTVVTDGGLQSMFIKQ